MEHETVFVTQKQFDEIPYVNAPVVELPHGKEPFKYSDGRSNFLVRGLNGEPEAQLLRVLANTPERRVNQMCEAGRVCNICGDLPPDNELSCEIQPDGGGDPENVIAYLCKTCFVEAVRNHSKREKRKSKLKRMMRKARSHGEKRTEPKNARSELKKKRKAGRKSRRSGR